MNEYFIQTDQFQISQADFLIRMLITIGSGLLIGLEREFSNQKENEIFVGIRTLSIVALIGFICAFLSFIIHPWLYAIGLVGVTVLAGISYWISAYKGDIGSTTEFTTIAIYLIGGILFLGHIEIGLALTVILLVLLSLKVKFKSIVGQITQKELYAFIRFVIISLLILPFLPNNNFGPFNVINLREIGWVIVLTSGVGFVGYILMKFIGSKRGILLTGILGGLVSSTVVSWVFSKKSKETPSYSSKYAIAIFAAAAIMVLRVFVWIFIFNKALINALLIPLIIILVAAVIVTLYFYNKQHTIQQPTEKLPLGQPLNIREAFVFGVLYTGILILVSYASNTYGDSGLYITSAISGLTDIDAITISMSKLGGDSVQILTAQNAILIATLANTIIKIGISLWFGSASLRKFVLLGYGIIFVGGILAFVILNS